jgi:hypothetical protein
METETWGEQIVRKARREHPWNFVDVDDDDLIDIIDGTILNPDDSKELPKNRSAYWNDEEGIVVITDPDNPDGGTAFRPDDGKVYFDRLPRRR